MRQRISLVEYSAVRVIESASRGANEVTGI